MSDDINKLEEIKVIVIGESWTGKTSLINVTIGEKFQDNLDSSYTSSFVQKKFKRGDNEYLLNIWDTSGQEKFRALNKIFFKNSKIVIFVYAINNKQSFIELQEYWVKTLRNELQDTPIYGIVGNKSDLFTEEKVKEDEAIQYSDSLGIKFKLVSAKQNPGGFIAFIEELLDDLLKSKGINTKRRNTISINGGYNKEKQKNCC